MNIQTMLASVTCKTGDGYRDIARFVLRLKELTGLTTVIASGGTAKYLRDNGIAVTDTSEVIGKFVRESIRRSESDGFTLPAAFEERLRRLEERLGKAFLNHRVATLSEEIHAAMLSDDTDEQDRELLLRFIERIDLTCVDFYELEKEIEREGSTRESRAKETDIGGPTMIRSTAKGSAAKRGRLVIATPEDRNRVIEWFEQGQKDETAFIDYMAAKGEATVGRYCIASARARGGDTFDGVIGEKAATGKAENAHQGEYALYAVGSKDPLAHSKFKQIFGIPMGYVNRTDLARLLRTMRLAAAAYDVNTGSVPCLGFIVKHGNASNAAYADDLHEMLRKLIDCDLEASFGGVVMVNHEIDLAAAEILLRYRIAEGEPRHKLDGIIAPSFTAEAIVRLQNKAGTCRLIVNPALATLNRNTIDRTPVRRQLSGEDYLKQPSNQFIPRLAADNTDLEMHGTMDWTKLRDLILAFAICATSNSNTVTLVKNGMLIGNGVAQTKRSRAAWLAIEIARQNGHDPEGAVVWSDSFFPFPDGPEFLLAAKVAVIFATFVPKKRQMVIDTCSGLATLLLMSDEKAREFDSHG